MKNLILIGEKRQILSLENPQSLEPHSTHVCDVCPDPNNDPDDIEVSEALKMHHEQSLSLFNQLIEAGVCREQARRADQWGIWLASPRQPDHGLG